MTGFDYGIDDWGHGLVTVLPDGAAGLRDPMSPDSPAVPLPMIVRDLREHGPVSNLHVLSHGGRGALQLGGQSFDRHGIDRQGERLAEIGSGIVGGVLLYGCDVAAGAVGRHFVDRLASATGRPVHASIDATGGLAAGGGTRQSVPASFFADAMRLHTGGIPRLQAGEVPTILRSDEEVLPRGDPRHRANGAMSGRVQVELHNEGGEKDASREAEVQLSPEGLVVRVFLEDLKRDGPMANGISQTFGVERGGGGR